MALFFFDAQDLLEGHWVAGDHIHYTSYLWGSNMRSVWEGLDSRKFKPKSEHIRYKHNLRERAEGTS